MNEFIQLLSEEFKGIYFLEGRLKGRYPYSNSMLIEDVLIDTGISGRYVKKLKKAHSIKKVLLSHWHEDHVSGNYFLPDAEYYCHAKDKFMVENLIEKMAEYYGASDTPVESFFEPLMVTLKIINTHINKTLKDNEVIEIGDYKLRIIHTPGHSAGHLSFFEEKSRIAFFGDIDLSRFPFYGCIDSSVVEFEKSIEKLKEFDIEIVSSGHKGVYRGVKLIKEKLNLYLSTINEREEKILEKLSETNPKIAEDLLNQNIIYKTYSDVEKDYEIIAEKIMIEKHFEQMFDNGLIEKRNNGYILK